MAKESKTLPEHLKVLKDLSAAMTQEINWVSINGQLKDDDLREGVHQLELDIFKVEKTIEKIEEELNKE